METPRPQVGPPSHVTLYRSVNGDWIADAELRENGDLAFCSGGSPGEWYVIVPASRIAALRDALERERPGGSGSILELVAARFAAPPGAPNPFEEIKAFLAQAGIDCTFDHW